MGRTLVTQTVEHVSDVHTKAASLHNPITRPVIDTKDLISGTEAGKYSIPNTADTTSSPKLSLNSRFNYDLNNDKGIDLGDYTEAFDHYYQSSNHSSAKPNITNFSNTAISASTENIKLFEQNNNIVNTPITGKDLNNVTHLSNSPTTSRLGVFQITIYQDLVLDLVPQLHHQYLKILIN